MPILTDSGVVKLEAFEQQLAQAQQRFTAEGVFSRYLETLVTCLRTIAKQLAENNHYSYWKEREHRAALSNAIKQIDAGRNTKAPIVYDQYTQEVAQILMSFLVSINLKEDFPWRIRAMSSMFDFSSGRIESALLALINNIQTSIDLYTELHACNSGREVKQKAASVADSPFVMVINGFEFLSSLIEYSNTGIQDTRFESACSHYHIELPEFEKLSIDQKFEKMCDLYEELTTQLPELLEQCESYGVGYNYVDGIEHVLRTKATCDDIKGQLHFIGDSSFMFRNMVAAQVTVIKDMEEFARVKSIPETDFSRCNTVFAFMKTKYNLDSAQSHLDDFEVFIGEIITKLKGYLGLTVPGLAMFKQASDALQHPKKTELAKSLLKRLEVIATETRCRDMPSDESRARAYYEPNSSKWEKGISYSICSRTFDLFTTLFYFHLKHKEVVGINDISFGKLGDILNAYLGRSLKFFKDCSQENDSYPLESVAAFVYDDAAYMPERPKLKGIALGSAEFTPLARITAAPGK